MATAYGWGWSNKPGMCGTLDCHTVHTSTPAPLHCRHAQSASALGPCSLAPHLIHARWQAHLQCLALPHPLAVFGGCVLPQRSTHDHLDRWRRPWRQGADVHKHVCCGGGGGAALRRRLVIICCMQAVCCHLVIGAAWPTHQDSQLQFPAGIAGGSTVAPHRRPHGCQHTWPQLGGVGHRCCRRGQGRWRAAAGAACCRCGSLGICLHHQSGAAGQAVDVKP